MVVLVACLDCRNLILSQSHYLLYCLAVAIEPRWLVTVDENLRVCDCLPKGIRKAMIHWHFAEFTGVGENRSKRGCRGEGRQSKIYCWRSRTDHTGIAMCGRESRISVGPVWITLRRAGGFRDPARKSKSAASCRISASIRAQFNARIFLQSTAMASDGIQV